MKNIRFPFALTAAALATALALASGLAQAQDKPVQLKMSSWVPAQHPLNPSLQAWADDIKKASGGTITATLFPSEQLGKAFDHYDMARDGIADFAYVNPGYQPGRFPIMAGASLPFLFANAKGGTAAIDAWYKQYAAQEMKDVKVCFAFVHDPGTFHARKKITLPTDIKGMKIRPATSTIGQMVTSLGGTNVQSSAPEARDMLERGVADAITFPWGSIVAVRHRQGGQVPHGRAAVRHAVRLGDEQGQVRQHVGRPEEGDRRPLHHRVGREGGQPLGRLRIRRPRQDRRRGRPRGLQAHAGPAQCLAPGRGARRGAVGRGREEGRARIPKAVMDSLKASLVKYKAAL